MNYPSPKLIVSELCDDFIRWTGVSTILSDDIENSSDSILIGWPVEIGVIP